MRGVSLPCLYSLRVLSISFSRADLFFAEATYLVGTPFFVFGTGANFLMIFYAFNPNISYDVIVPKGETWKSGILSFFFGSKDWEVVRMTGGLMLASFMEIGQMVIAFYVVPPKR